MKKTTLLDTGERMIPEFHQGGLIYAEHVARYAAAVSFTRDKVVLDIASGSGYGTKVLSQFAQKVIGVDVDSDAVKYAKENFPGKNITYLEGSATDIPVDDNEIDLLVTFETIEHISEYEKFLLEMKRVLKSDGVAIVSTPNELEFAEGNHFHLHEFEYEELELLLKKHFKYTKAYFQATWKAVAIGTEEEFSKNNQKLSLELDNFAPLARDKYLYFYIICSDQPIIDEVVSIAALGEHYSERKVLGEQEDAKNVKTELKRREKLYEELSAHAQTMSNELERLRQNVILSQQALEDIKNSKAYKLSRKISRTKGVFSKTKDK